MLENIELSDIKTLFEVFESSATIIALFIGGLWTYKNFIRGRIDQPQLSIKIEASDREIPDGKILLSLNINLHNTGKVLIKLREETIRIQRIIPLPENVEQKIKENFPLEEAIKNQEWKRIGKHKLSWEEEEYILEPGEKDNRNLSFIIDERHQTIRIYTYYRSFEEKRLGWNDYIIYDLKAYDHRMDK